MEGPTLATDTAEIHDIRAGKFWKFKNKGRGTENQVKSQSRYARELKCINFNQELIEKNDILIIRVDDNLKHGTREKRCAESFSKMRINEKNLVVPIINEYPIFVTLKNTRVWKYGSTLERDVTARY